MHPCGVTLTVLTYSTFSYVTSTPVNPDHSLLSGTNLVNVATFTHCIACLFTAVTYNKIADLTPYYLFDEDAVDFHENYKNICDVHGRKGTYDICKQWCDDYFYLPARQENN